MDLILATADGREERVLDEDLDLDIGKTDDFVLYASYGTWLGDLAIDKLLYIPDTEYGGVIKRIKTATNTGNIDVKGYTWRGYLAHRIIQPPSGSDYYTASGELNSIISNLVNIPNFVVPNVSTGVTVNYQFERYTTVADGLSQMLASVGYRLDIKYIQTQTGGYVQVQALPVKEYGGEYSQYSLIEFATDDNQMGVNHLICLGKGELRDRIVVHLYADANGNISQSQTFFGLDEIVQVYDNPGAELETLIENGTDKLKNLISSKTFTTKVNDIDTELYYGDIIAGTDYITGISVKKPIVEKIVKRNLGLLSIEYKIEDK